MQEPASRRLLTKGVALPPLPTGRLTTRPEGKAMIEAMV